MDIAKIAYLAGIFDGEGSIRHRTRYKSRVAGLQIRVTNTNQELLTWIQTYFGGWIYALRKACDLTCEMSHVHKRKDSYAWYISGTRAMAILETILPYLIVKKQAALFAVLDEHSEPLETDDDEE